MSASVGTPLLWTGFTLFVLIALVLDLGLFHRHARAVSLREATLWSVVWVGLALAFNAGVYRWLGHEKGLEFLTGYLIELALSVDVGRFQFRQIGDLRIAGDIAPGIGRVVQLETPACIEEDALARRLRRLWRREVHVVADRQNTQGQCHHG